MQREIGDNVHLAQTILVFDSMGGVQSIDRTASDFDAAREKVEKLNMLIDRGEYGADVARYIPGTLELVYQRMLDKIKTMEQPAHPSYKDKETFHFHLLLGKNHYTNLNSLHICFPIRFQKVTNAAAAIDGTLAPVNNFFDHWVKEIDITKYGTNKQLIPTFTPQEIYQYSDAMPKHLLEKNLRKLRNIFCLAKSKLITLQMLTED